MTEVWILGGTGRSGRAIAAELLRRGIEPVLVGRDAARLTATAAELRTAADGADGGLRAVVDAADGSDVRLRAVVDAADSPDVPLRAAMDGATGSTDRLRTVDDGADGGGLRTVTDSADGGPRTAGDGADGDGAVADGVLRAVDDGPDGRMRAITKSSDGGLPAAVDGSDGRLRVVSDGSDGRLRAVGGGSAGGLRTLVAGSVGETADAIRRERPAVVVNTIGPFAETAAPLLAACLPSSHYLDLANDLAAVSATLGQDRAFAAAGRTAVTGAGFGVTATESVVVKLCEGRPAPRRVRVDMVPSLASEDGVVGDALAGTIVEGLPGVEGGGRFQGRRYRDGRLAPAPLGGDPTRLVLPDGSAVTTAGMPLGELMAAQRASGAPDVIAASSEAPSSALVRAVLPAATGLLAIGPVRAFARRRLAALRFKAKPKPREHSWGHAVAHWPDGSVREGWLRVGEAQAWTGAVPAEIVRRLLDGQGRPGAYTPAALFGSGLAEACGGTFEIVGE